MKSTGFWIRRYLVVAAVASVLLVGVGMLKGRTLERAAPEALFWGVVSAGVFTAARYRSARKGEACALCRDTVED